MMQSPLRRCAPVLFAAGLLVGGLSAGSSAQRTELPLPELLRSTHVHGLAVDRADRGSLLIATHHGLYRARIETGEAELVSERTDDFMGFTPHPIEESVLYASGHPAGRGTWASSPRRTEAGAGATFLPASADPSTFIRWTSARPIRA